MSNIHSSLGSLKQSRTSQRFAAIVVYLKYTYVNKGQLNSICRLCPLLNSLLPASNTVISGVFKAGIVVAEAAVLPFCSPASVGFASSALLQLQYRKPDQRTDLSEKYFPAPF